MMLRLQKMDEKKLWISIAYPLKITSHRWKMRSSVSGKGHQFRRGADIMWLKWPDSCGQRETTYVRVGNRNVARWVPQLLQRWCHWHYRCSDDASDGIDGWCHDGCYRFSDDATGIIAAAAAAPTWHVLISHFYVCCLSLPTTVWPFQSYGVCTLSEMVPFPRCWESHLSSVLCNS